MRRRTTKTVESPDKAAAPATTRRSTRRGARKSESEAEEKVPETPTAVGDSGGESGADSVDPDEEYSPRKSKQRGGRRGGRGRVAASSGSDREQVRTPKPTPTRGGRGRRQLLNEVVVGDLSTVQETVDVEPENGNPEPTIPEEPVASVWETQVAPESAPVLSEPMQIDSSPEQVQEQEESSSPQRAEVEETEEVLIVIPVVEEDSKDEEPSPHRSESLRSTSPEELPIPEPQKLPEKTNEEKTLTIELPPKKQSVLVHEDDSSSDSSSSSDQSDKGAKEVIVSKPPKLLPKKQAAEIVEEKRKSDDDIKTIAEDNKKAEGGEEPINGQRQQQASQEVEKEATAVPSIKIDLKETATRKPEAKRRWDQKEGRGGGDGDKVVEIKKRGNEEKKKKAEEDGDRRKGKLEHEDNEESLQPQLTGGDSRFESRRHPRLQHQQSAAAVSSEEGAKPRKRRWASRKASESVIAISTDSLKGIIEDVKPVPLSDVKLDSSTDEDEAPEQRPTGDDPEQQPSSPKDESSDSNTSADSASSGDGLNGEKAPISVQNALAEEVVEGPQEVAVAKREVKLAPGVAEPPGAASLLIRKISIVDEVAAKETPLPKSTTKNAVSSILYITNLVRPFTVLQLKGLLARTGKIVENGFWIDKIKSKCFVQYETEDEAFETRHALHGVRWPVSNPKCLNVDFGVEAAMQKAIASTAIEGGARDQRDFRMGGDRLDLEERRKEVVRPVREWDVGKKEQMDGDRDRSRDRGGEQRDENLDRNRRKRSGERELERTRSLSADRRAAKLKKENEPPIRLLDDLFRKTKTTPCIYWLPLTPEQIGVKEEVRRKNLAEHQRRMEEIQKLGKEREEERRKREKERARERDKDRNRSHDRKRSRSHDRRRYR